MRAADYPRSANRARIDNLFNGVAPYTQEEQVQNRINTNVNWLDATRIHQDACRQFENGIMKPGNYFTVKLDSGPIHQRTKFSDIITAVKGRDVPSAAFVTFNCVACFVASSAVAR